MLQSGPFCEKPALCHQRISINYIFNLNHIFKELEAIFSTRVAMGYHLLPVMWKSAPQGVKLTSHRLLAGLLAGPLFDQCVPSPPTINSSEFSRQIFFLLSNSNQQIHQLKLTLH